VIRDLLDAAMRGLTRNVAFTSPGAEDPRLEGRTYAIPFEDVWQASLDLVRGGLRRWEVTEHNDQEGIIRGVARGHLERTTSSITVRITLDPNAQTRVDAMAASRTGRGDLGRNARRLGRFFATLDARLARRRGAGIESLRVDRAATASTT
jgi:hypothetical protein